MSYSIPLFMANCRAASICSFISPFTNSPHPESHAQPKSQVQAFMINMYFYILHLVVRPRPHFGPSFTHVLQEMFFPFLWFSSVQIRLDTYFPLFLTPVCNSKSEVNHNSTHIPHPPSISRHSKGCFYSSIHYLFTGFEVMECVYI